MSANRSWFHGRNRWRRALAVVTAALIAGGAGAIGIAAASQDHAPQPSPAAAGDTGPGGDPAGARPTTARGPVGPPASPAPATQGPLLPASVPVAIAIPAIGVHSYLQALGLNPDGTLQVPQPGPLYNEAAWYKYSPTPGQIGPSIIEGHIDSAADGPSVFYRLGALKPGDQIDITRADHTIAIFTVTGVRQYPKTAFPTGAVYGNTNFAALRLVTCGGSFNETAHSYVDNTVVFSSLTTSQPAS